MLITHAKLITWDTPNQILEDYALVIVDGKILELGPTAKIVAAHPDHKDRLDAGGQYVMPGIINSHGHYCSAFLRGMPAPGLPGHDLHTILQRIFWVYDRAMNHEDTRYATLTYAIDAIRGGTTTQFDHQESPDCADGSLDVVAEAVDQAGVRAVLCFETTDRLGPATRDAGLRENARFIARCNKEDVAGGRVKANFGLHAPFTLTDDTLALAREAAPEGTGFHIHVAEHEYDEWISQYLFGTHSIDRLHKFGILTDKTICAHSVHLDCREVELVADKRAWISHNPRSNMWGGTGVAEAESYNRAGARTCIGNDGLSNCLWRDWQTSYLAHKLKHRDPRRMPASRVIELACYNGGQLASTYYGLPVGVIKPGAAADLIFVDYHSWTPVTVDNLPDHIIMGFLESMITTTIVAGKVLMKDRQILTLDEEKINAEARQVAAKLWKRFESMVPPGMGLPY
jgi:putative selenium metabolism protein SsnA